MPSNYSASSQKLSSDRFRHPTKIPWPETNKEVQKEASQALDDVLKALANELGQSDES